MLKMPEKTPETGAPPANARRRFAAEGLRLTDRIKVVPRPVGLLGYVWVQGAHRVEGIGKRDFWQKLAAHFRYRAACVVFSSSGRVTEKSAAYAAFADSADKMADSYPATSATP
jgi:hypothetical protein